MSCITKNYFVAGDTFNLVFRFFDKEANEGFSIPENSEIQSQIRDRFGALIAGLTCTINPDQISDETKGFVTLTFSGDTSTWKHGLASLDIALLSNNSIKHSGRLNFEIVDSITKVFDNEY